MARRILFFLLVFVCVATFANPVSKEEAKSKAMEFLTNTSIRKAMPANGSMQLSDAVESTEYYVFNIGNDSGFLLMSASDLTQPILGYSENGSFDLSNMPLPMAEWLEELSAGIKAIERHEAKLTANNTNGPRKALGTKNAIPYLVPSKWNQGDPYNALCPEHESGICATGCVATAMAQVMYYWRWPQEACTNIPAYTWNYNGKGTVLPEMESTTFNWDAMTDTYDSSSSPSSKSEVAKLMRYVGQALQMGYGPASGAGVGMPPFALAKYFGYDPGCHHVGHDVYNYLDWENLIYSEIAAGRPILMNAHCAGDNGGGHEFVVDGYDGNGYYHINWGWGGMNDGYFLLTVMNPDEQGIGGSDSADGYSMGQGIVVGVQPNRGDPFVEDYHVTISDVSVTRTELTRSNKSRKFIATISYRFGNGMKDTYDFEHGFALYDAEGNLVSEPSSKESITMGTGTTTRNAGCQFGGNLDDGTYYLKGCSRIKGTEEWIPDDGSNEYVITATVHDELNCTLSVGKKRDLSVTEFNLIGSGSVGAKQKVEVKIMNNGFDYYGDLYLLEDGMWKSGNCVYLPSGKTTTVYFNYTPEKSGNHRLTISTSTSTGNSIYTENRTISEESKSTLSYTTSILSNWEPSGGSNVVYGNQFRIKVTIRNAGPDAYNDYIEVSPWEVSGGYYWKRASYKQDVSIEPKGSQTLEFTIPDLNYNSSYNFHIDSNNCGSTNRGDYKFIEGITYWTADGIMHGLKAASGQLTVTSDVVAVKIPGTSNVPSASYDNCNPNVVLMFNKNASISSRTMNIIKNNVNNIIFGDHADQIIIDGSRDFFLPQNLSTDNLTFNITIPELKADEKWATITLPFVPQSIHTEDGEVNLHIEEFAAVDGNKMYFEEIGAFVPNRPYIFALATDDYNLSGKTLTFTASDASLECADFISTYSNEYHFVGTMLGCQQENAFILAPDGTHFKRVERADIKPFEAYFVANDATAAERNYLLVAGRGTDADGIGNISITDYEEGIFTIGGMQIAAPQKGINIIRLKSGQTKKIIK